MSNPSVPPSREDYALHSELPRRASPAEGEVRRKGNSPLIVGKTYDPATATRIGGEVTTGEADLLREIDTRITNSRQQGMVIGDFIPIHLDLLTRCRASIAANASLRATFDKHTEAVAGYLNELYAVMVDPCATEPMKVADVKAALLSAATRNRDACASLRAKLEERDADAERAMTASKTALDAAVPWLESVKTYRHKQLALAALKAIQIARQSAQAAKRGVGC